tara:strand:- start:837 stop:1460 length:624 start_codon:yes stop_codon:yes gene_type:complete
MSYFERNLKYLNNKSIIYRRDPITDIPTESYDWGNYYINGTHQCYTLFRSSAKINTYKSLKWHLYVLWHLNPQLYDQDFQNLAIYICNIKNGFLTFNISDSLVNNMVKDVGLQDVEKPPPNKLRKIIFKEFSGLTMKQKLSIVGKMIGRNKIVDEELIYQCMLDLNDLGKKITWSRVAKLLNCSSRTIYRNISKQLKKEKQILNKEL